MTPATAAPPRAAPRSPNGPDQGVPLLQGAYPGGQVYEVTHGITMTVEVALDNAMAVEVALDSGWGADELAAIFAEAFVAP
jgi:hypothetical protein